MSHQVIALKVNSKLNQVRYFTTCGADLNVTALPCWMRVCVRESESKGVPSDYETHPLPKLLVCFHGEVKSALKKRLHPIIRDGGRSAWHGSDDEPYSPCSSFPWQWLNEILVMEGWAQTGRRVTDAFHIFIFLPSASVSDLYLSLSSDHKAVIIILIDVILYANSYFFFLFLK